MSRANEKTIVPKEAAKLAFMLQVLEKTLFKVSPMAFAPKMHELNEGHTLWPVYQKFVDKVQETIHATTKSPENAAKQHAYMPPLYDLKAMIAYVVLELYGEDEFDRVKHLPITPDPAVSVDGDKAILYSEEHPNDLMSYFESLLTEAKQPATAEQKNIFVFHDQLEDADDITAITLLLVMAKRLNLKVHLIAGANAKINATDSIASMFIFKLVHHLQSLKYVVDHPVVMDYDKAKLLTPAEMEGADIFQCSPIDHKMIGENWYLANRLIVQGGPETAGGLNLRGAGGSALRERFRAVGRPPIFVEREFCSNLFPSAMIMGLMPKEVQDLLLRNAFLKLCFRCPSVAAGPNFDPLTLIQQNSRFLKGNVGTGANWQSLLAWADMCGVKVPNWGDVKEVEIDLTRMLLPQLQQLHQAIDYCLAIADTYQSKKIAPLDESFVTQLKTMQSQLPAKIDALTASKQKAALSAPFASNGANSHGSETPGVGNNNGGGSSPAVKQKTLS